MYRTSERVVEPERVSVRCEIERTECRPLFSAETDARVDPCELTLSGFPLVAIASLIMRMANSHAYRSVPSGKSGSDSRHSDLRVLMVIGRDRDKSALP